MVASPSLITGSMTVRNLSSFSWVSTISIISLYSHKLQQTIRQSGKLRRGFHALRQQRIRIRTPSIGSLPLSIYSSDDSGDTIFDGRPHPGLFKFRVYRVQNFFGTQTGMAADDFQDWGFAEHGALQIP